MDYAEALEYIHSFQRFGSSPSLERIGAVLAELGHPERGPKFVHIAGTNGKGSVTAMTDAVLRAAGLRTGRYISPYLERFNERINFDGRDIADDELAAVTAKVRAAVDRAAGRGAERPVEFDVTTAVGFLYYAEKQAEWVALEVGLGGTWDSTNVIAPAVSVITSIGYDHLAILGPTLADIAANKAGIIKPGRPAVARCADPGALAVIEAEAERAGSPLTVIGRDVTWSGRADGLSGQTVDIKGPGWCFDGLRVPLIGAHQQENAATAVTALKILAAQGEPIDDDAIRRGVAATVWPGRLEVMGRRPLVMLDGAHNPQAAEALAAALAGIERRRTILVVGILGDKDITPVLGNLLPLADRVIVTTPASVRACPPETVAAAAVASGAAPVVIADAHKAVEVALAEAGEEDLVLVTGSLYLVGDVRPELRRLLNR